jgi:ATP-dependent Clp protease adaptor protein ClpS
MQNDLPLYDPMFADDTDVGLGFAARVVLFDDDWHTFDEVIQQVVLATKCSNSQAEAVAFTVHHQGRGIAFEGDMSQCVRVSSILEQIELRTSIEL